MFLDGKGDRRAVFEAAAGMSGLDLFDTAGKPRARLLVGDTGPRLVFTDATGQEIRPLP
jgi:hypothetical protein